MGEEVAVVAESVANEGLSKLVVQIKRLIPIGDVSKGRELAYRGRLGVFIITTKPARFLLDLRDPFFRRRAEVVLLDYDQSTLLRQKSIQLYS